MGLGRVAACALAALLGLARMGQVMSMLVPWEEGRLNIVRKAWLALALSLAAPGLGHLYCGRPFKGIVLMLAAPFLAPLWMWVSFWQPSGFALAVLLLMTGGLLALYLYAFFYAYRLARREGRDYIRRPYNRMWVYGVFLLAGWAVPGFFSGQVRDHGFQA